MRRKEGRPKVALAHQTVSTGSHLFNKTWHLITPAPTPAPTSRTRDLSKFGETEQIKGDKETEGLDNFEITPIETNPEAQARPKSQNSITHHPD